MWGILMGNLSINGRRLLGNEEAFMFCDCWRFRNWGDCHVLTEQTERLSVIVIASSNLTRTARGKRGPGGCLGDIEMYSVREKSGKKLGMISLYILMIYGSVLGSSLLTGKQQRQSWLYDKLLKIKEKVVKAL